MMPSEPRLQLQFIYIYITDCHLHQKQMLHEHYQLHINKIARISVNIVLYLSSFDEKKQSTQIRKINRILLFYNSVLVPVTLDSATFLSKHRLGPPHH